MTDLAKIWGEKAAKALVGKKIVNVQYITPKDAENLCWYGRSIALELDDGSVLWPSMDDEGNNAGAMFTTIEGIDVIPVLPC